MPHYKPIVSKYSYNDSRVSFFFSRDKEKRKRKLYYTHMILIATGN
jgi:hypothetical protein